MGLPHWTGDQAATVQAVAAVAQTAAAILALAIAVGVPLWQRRRERKQSNDDRQAQAVAIVCILTPDLIMLREQMDQVEGYLRGLAEAIDRGDRSTMVMGKLPTLQKPAALIDCLDRIHVLGHAAVVRIMHLLSSLDRFNSAGRAETRLAEAAEVRKSLDRLNEALSQV